MTDPLLATFRASVALELLAKSEPFAIRGGSLVGDGIPPVPCSTDADAALANLAFQRGVSRAIEAFANAQKETPACASTTH